MIYKNGPPNKEVDLIIHILIQFKLKVSNLSPEKCHYSLLLSDLDLRPHVIISAKYVLLKKIV